MRTIGTLPDEREARLFDDYLLTLDIKAMVESEGDEWIVWIYDEDHLETARDELAKFRDDPAAPRYQVVRTQAVEIRKVAEKQDAVARKRVVSVRDRWNRTLMQQAPLTMVLIAVSIFVTLASNRGNNVEPIVRMLGFSEFHAAPNPGKWNLHPTTARGDEQIRTGQIWRLVTPIFIHLSLMHLAFNMYWLFQFGRMIESRRGTIRLASMILLIAVFSCYMQFAATDRPRFGGMSGVGYGLFGYLWMKTRFDPGAGMFLPQSTILLMMVWFFLCWSGIGFFSGVANWAHTVGLIVGVILGHLPIALRNLQRR